MTFTVTPAADAAVNTNYKISAHAARAGGQTGYTDQVVRVVSPVEGRFQRWGNWAEYDNWLEDAAPPARRLGRSAAIQTIGVGETFTLPVDVHNWSTTAQSGTVSLTLPAGVHAPTRRPSRTGRSRRGADDDGQLHRLERFTNATLPGRRGHDAEQQTTNVTIASRRPTRAGGTGFEDLTLAHRARRRRSRRPPPRRRSTAPRAPASTPARRSTSAASGSRAAATATAPAGRRLRLRPARPATRRQHLRQGHPLRRRPVLLHPRQGRLPVLRGQAGRVRRALAGGLGRDPHRPARQRLAVLKDTANTFKLGIFPFTNDPATRTATAPTARAGRVTPTTTRASRPGRWRRRSPTPRTRPACRSSRRRRGSARNDTTVDHAYGAAAATTSRSRSRWRTCRPRSTRPTWA